MSISLTPLSPSYNTHSNQHYQFPNSFDLKTTNFHPKFGKTESNNQQTIRFSSSNRGRLSAIKSAGGDDAGSSPAKSLRKLLASPGIHLGPACFDALSAKLVERAGFDFCFTTGNWTQLLCHFSSCWLLLLVSIYANSQLNLMPSVTDMVGFTLEGDENIDFFALILN